MLAVYPEHMAVVCCVMQATAELYNKLGLPEYEAMEAFVRYCPYAPSHLFKNRAASKGARGQSAS